MKKLLFAIALFTMSQATLAQEQIKSDSESPMGEVKKESTIHILGKSYHIIKYENGARDFRQEDNYTTQLTSRTSTFFDVDLGKGVWTGNEAAPDTKVWGSWNVGLNSGVQTKIAGNFYLKSAIGVNWYNFKFDDPNTQALKGPTEVIFLENQLVDARRSKISASYLNLSLVPKFDAGSEGFRFGVGAYAGYRIGGRSKFVFDDEDGDKTKTYDKSNMFLSDIRYGVRAEIGFKQTDFFVTYDLNEVFREGRGPEVNAFSFGFIW